jgi:hypothetical protein
MRSKTAVVSLSLTIALTFGTSVDASHPAKKFKNCTDLRKAFPSGVAKDAKSAGNSGAVVNAKVYRENIGSDRDKDGIACETS